MAAYLEAALQDDDPAPVAAALGDIAGATRWVFIAIKRRKTAAAGRSFLNEVAKAATFVISTILTDNGKELIDRLFGSRAKGASGEHEFDLLCESLDIEHRLTKPRTPRTNGMVERFNRRLEQVLQTHRFNSAEDLSKTLHRYVSGPG